jgi:hypothetical protein
VGGILRNLTCLVVAYLAISCAASGLVTDELLADELQPGFQQVSGRYLDVITDLPLTEELRELPRVFDSAMPVWCEMFGLQESEVADWHARAFIMLDRPRFQTAGYLPASLPNFPYGFQSGDQLWIAEQPSAYYRRHLLLHEGTHWFMTRKYGQNGPPWLMEGMAEWLGTHRWDGEQLTMGMIPESKNTVPYWGRITLIQQQLADGLAPSLETVLRYGDTAHQEVEAYAWSWAAVLFLRNHPDTADTFRLLLQQPMRPDASLNRWLYRRLVSRWPQLRQQWSAMLTDLEYGYDPSRGMLLFSPDAAPLTGHASCRVQSQFSWQASKIQVQAGATVKISAEGEFVVGQDPKPWLCQPNGVTLEYYRGRPLGELLMTVATPIDREPDYAVPLSAIPVGSGGTFTIPKSGELQFRINEASGGLSDNSGTISITVKP